MTKLQTLLVSAAAGTAAFAIVGAANALTPVTLTATTTEQSYTVPTNSAVTIDYDTVTPEKLVYYGLYGSSVLVTSDALGPVMGTGSVSIPGTVYAGVTIKYELTPVPEPAAWALMLVGFGGLGAAMRRRNAKVAGSAA